MNLSRQLAYEVAKCSATHDSVAATPQAASLATPLAVEVQQGESGGATRLREGGVARFWRGTPQPRKKGATECMLHCVA